MGCDNSELWITYKQNSRGNKPATTQLIELEFQSHKLNDLEDVLDHVFAQGWVEAHYRALVWWEKHDGYKLKNSERVETLLKEGVGECESSSLKLVIADCPSVLWISYVFLKCPNAHASVQRINLVDAADPCAKFERLAHVANYIFRKGFLPGNVRSLVHWEDTNKKCIEEHVTVKHVLCERDVGRSEDKPLRLVIGWVSAFILESMKAEADFGFKTIRPVTAETRDNTTEDRMRTVILEQGKAPSPYLIPSTPTLPLRPLSPLTPFSFTYVESASSLWTFHIILFGAVLFLSWTGMLYPRACCCVREHCPIQ